MDDVAVALMLYHGGMGSRHIACEGSTQCEGKEQMAAAYS